MVTTKSEKRSHLKNLVMYPGKIRTPSELLLEVIKEETILFSLDKGETPKENERAAYKNVQEKTKVKLTYFKTAPMKQVY